MSVFIDITGSYWTLKVIRYFHSIEMGYNGGILWDICIYIYITSNQPHDRGVSYVSVIFSMFKNKTIGFPCLFLLLTAGVGTIFWSTSGSINSVNNSWGVTTPRFGDSHYYWTWYTRLVY